MSSAVTAWIRQHATPLATTDPTAPLTDLAPLPQVVGDAQVVGLGESTHGAHEQFALKHRVVRLLVEKLGFGCVALEEDWTKGLQLDQYLVTGKGDPRALLADAGPPWRTEEILQLLTWMQSYNQTHPDGKVRFAGVDVVAVGPLAYDAVAEYVERAAPIARASWSSISPPFARAATSSNISGGFTASPTSSRSWTMPSGRTTWWAACRPAKGTRSRCSTPRSSRPSTATTPSSGLPSGTSRWPRTSAGGRIAPATRSSTGPRKCIRPTASGLQSPTRPSPRRRGEAPGPSCANGTAPAMSPLA